MEFFPALLSEAESNARAAGITHQIEANGYGLWAVEVPGVADFIGFAGLNRTGFDAPFSPCIEVGWRLAHDYWGSGYATEAASAAITDGFERLALDEIVSYTAVTNVRSRRVMEKLRMTHSPSEDFDHPSLPAGHPLRQHALYRLHRRDWTPA